MNPDLVVVLFGHDRCHTIGSSIMKLRMYLENDLNARYRIVWVDDGSADGTEWFARRAGAFVVRYGRRQERDRVIWKAVEICVQNDRPLSVILDIDGGNTADDAIGLIRAAVPMKGGFDSGWIVPVRGSRTIGCLAMNRKSLDGLFKHGKDINSYLLKKMRTPDLVKTRYSEEEGRITKLKEGGRKKVENVLVMFTRLRRKHSLKFYGGLGLLIVLLAMASGFYTVDYFYKNQNLYYPTAFLTVGLTMIGGFLMVAGLVLNAMNVMVGKLRSAKRWEKAAMEIRQL